MQIHPSLSRQITITRHHDARAAADRARLVRAARCAAASPVDLRRRPVLRRACEDPLPA
jgi:predicted nucleic acid-binding Zn ribbon protein